jgi:hypothetical protein
MLEVIPKPTPTGHKPYKMQLVHPVVEKIYCVSCEFFALFTAVWRDVPVKNFIFISELLNPFWKKVGQKRKPIHY